MMKKLFIIQVFVLIILICGNTAMSYAQDTSKQVKKATAIKPVAVKKYYPVYKTSKYKPVNAGPGTITVRKDSTPVQPQPATLDATSLTDKSLRGQYQYLLSKLFRYQQPLVSALWKNYSDTLNLTRQSLKQAQIKLAEQSKTISNLQADVNTKGQVLSESNAKVNEVSLLGIPVTKSTYNLIMWGLLVLFGAVAAIVIMTSGANKREATYRIRLYNELEEEHKLYKAKANEKEKKLARELQTERNKVDELMGRG